MHGAPTGQATLADVSQRCWAILGVPEVTATHARRLAELGLRAGARVRVLLDTVGGGRVVAIGAGRIALDGATCRRIPVSGASANPVAPNVEARP